MTASDFYQQRFGFQPEGDLTPDDISMMIFEIECSHIQLVKLLDVITDASENSSYDSEHTYALAKGAMAILAGMGPILVALADHARDQGRARPAEAPPTSNGGIHREPRPGTLTAHIDQWRDFRGAWAFRDRSGGIDTHGPAKAL